MTLRTHRALVPGIMLAAVASRALNLRHNLRHNGRLPNPPVPAYYEIEMQWRWTRRPNMAVARIGRNLLHRSHIAFGGLNGRSSYERTALVKVTWRD